MKRCIYLLISCLLASCGGSAGMAVPPTHRAVASSLVTIHLAVPTASAARTEKLRRVLSLAANTAGASVTAYTSGSRTNALATTVADISPASANCTATSNGGRNCTFAISAPPGNNDFVITTFDQTPSGGSIPGSAHELGYGVATVTIAAGAPATVSATLSSVLASVNLALVPNAIHTIIPSTTALDVYPLDADGDVIVSNGFVDAQGNPVTLSFSTDQNLNGSLSLNPSSITAPAPNGIQVAYSGQASGGGTVNVSISSSSPAVTTGTAALNAIYPTFTAISDPNLQPNNPYHGGMVTDSSGGVYYTTPTNFGGISYYSGSGTSVASNYAATAPQPIRGGLAQSVSTLFALTGTTAQTFSAPPSSTIAPVGNAQAAPLPNGSGMVYDTAHAVLWYFSGSALAEYPVLSGAPTVVSVGTNAIGGVALDASDNVWAIDNVNDALIEYNGSVNSFPLAPGGAPFDVLANTNGIFVTDHGATPAILQISSGGSIAQTIQVPNGAVPWYLMPDNAQPGVIWFDYLQNGQIGLGRVDTNVAPATFSMATFSSGPFGSQAGALAAASDGRLYMVFENTQTLVQVQR